MLCATISGPSMIEAQKQVSYLTPYVDCCELRTDLLDFHIEKLLPIPTKLLITSKPLPALEWIERTTYYASLSPHYIDVDYTFPKRSLANLKKRYPEVKWILSFHSNHYVDPLTIVPAMQGSDYIKIAVTPANHMEMLHCLTRKALLPSTATLIAMGQHGQLSRILSPILCNTFNYVAQQPVAPGQLSLDDLNRYNYHNLSSSGSIYGLIGSNPQRSLSDLSHNCLFSSLRLDSCYIKLSVQPHELSTLFSLIKDLPIRGLSVTSPLKRAVLDYLDDADTSLACGACNTLTRKSGRWIGSNTDGTGLCRVLQNHGISPYQKHIGILGSGGAAHAIAFALAENGARLYLFSRSPAYGLAAICDAKTIPLENLPSYPLDILINCLPPNVHLPQGRAPIFIDINTLEGPPHLPWQPKIIFGTELFIEQAQLQFQQWFPEKLTSKSLNDFRKNVLSISGKVMD